MRIYIIRHGQTEYNKIGMIGSGKTTATNKYRNDNNYITNIKKSSNMKCLASAYYFFKPTKYY